MPKLELVVFSTGNEDNSKRSAKFYILYSTTICTCRFSRFNSHAPAGPTQSGTSERNVSNIRKQNRTSEASRSYMQSLVSVCGRAHWSSKAIAVQYLLSVCGHAPRSSKAIAMQSLVSVCGHARRSSKAIAVQYLVSVCGHALRSSMATAM